MTRRIAGPFPTTKTTVPYALPIGHLSTKSSVYSPVSMSRMSQDLVLNHMKSHYQRISSAKACVDTSVPKSMKLTIKEKDRKRKEALLASNIQRTSRSSSRQSKVSDSPRDWDNSETFNHIPANGIVSMSSRIPRTSSQALRENDNMKQRHHKQRLKEPAKQTPRDKEDSQHPHDYIEHSRNTDQYNYQRFERRKTDHKNSKMSEPNIANTNSVGQKNHIDDYERTNHRADQTTENFPRMKTNGNATTSELDITDIPQLHTSSQREGWNDLRNKTLENDLEEHRTTHRLYTSTPRFEKEQEVGMNSSLGLSTMTFSYKSPPTRRKPRKKNAEEMIWTEEQKYLQFISDVTSDVLARGICSNRVINKVFESHIEKRKGDLNEGSMREMINQLKEDLGVTND